MRTALVLIVALLSVGCAGISTNTTWNEQFDGETMRHELEIVFGIKVPPEAWAKLDGEQIVKLAEIMAKASDAMMINFHPEWHQTIGAESTTTTEQEWRSDIEATLEGLLE